MTPWSRLDIYTVYLVSSVWIPVSRGRGQQQEEGCAVCEHGGGCGQTGHIQVTRWILVPAIQG